MTTYGSLFERLGGAPAEQSKNREEATRDSVTAHLSKMLSTRAGSVLALPDYGMPDLNNMSVSLHDALTQGAQVIKRFIEVYEPRLSEVQLVSTPNGVNPLKLGFSIEAQLEVDGIKSSVLLSAKLTGGGHITVK
ncbi:MULTISPECIES: type VI secretion system baseplate subunit TssE [unclassified Pseudomonas]|uniref:type VI secretion system baseplate subunit TssE n=1 Tax=unclassified Pseudomonas TaxID=196821 RepID=UPI002AC9AC78|nr:MULTISPECIES: type VI secretion system baseplate subunit TssE [unclassified Pseudomonas]MEB0039078.1 type VI secretion system baseplate subunit TssE [Pseudomonas sp. MH10]MEB0079615.1 type VI secretion system baseplate subunit TssE [Pseudomonas sp. MH10out]MEB0092550.1 type VI secretion system baseplate subunit TssE [Pseudomonas sp. CCI4.2]MEB0103821.1 type VI secretion system baseplate subunit TssE [Pseudomonas sp. CCI3.2]MEB0122192.1 type VI secretion system baseplate subunit TssE [Pseudo